jgi:hypothetical protein
MRPFLCGAVFAHTPQVGMISSPNVPGQRTFIGAIREVSGLIRESHSRPLFWPDRSRSSREILNVVREAKRALSSVNLGARGRDPRRQREKAGVASVASRTRRATVAGGPRVRIHLQRVRCEPDYSSKNTFGRLTKLSARVRASARWASNRPFPSHRFGRRSLPNHHTGPHRKRPRQPWTCALTREPGHAAWSFCLYLIFFEEIESRLRYRSNSLWILLL